jgi:DNA/RNA endonuclease G, NUC1
MIHTKVYNRFLNIFKPILILAAICLAVAACGGGADPVVLPAKLALSKTSASSGAGSQFVEVQASGIWTIDVKTSDGGSWASVSPASGKDSKNNVILEYSENSSETDRSLTLVLTAGKQNAEAVFTQSGKPQVEPETPSYDGKRYGVDVSTCGWLELPVTEKDDRDMFTLFMTVGGNKVRNMSYDWNYGELVSHWVAYPLNKTLMGSGGRSNAWGFDPNMPVSAQSNITMRGFNPSTSFARGHQCPSADRLANEAANMQTFYGTNMTPQMHDFNEGIWAGLENKVRSIANALNSATDTLYVVTGCVVAPNSVEGTHGAVGGYALDNDGKRVAIPTGYYKALLRYQKNSTYGYKGYAACAFYFDHKDYGSDSVSKSMAISIDELEDKTGIDFFGNLAGVIGVADADKVEAQDPKNVGIWW